jgi:hypothetical protein
MVIPTFFQTNQSQQQPSLIVGVGEKIKKEVGVWAREEVQEVCGVGEAVGTGVGECSWRQMMVIV